MIEEIKKKTGEDLEKILSLAGDDLKSVKTGRAKPSLVEDLRIEAYQSQMMLKELASINAPDPHTLVISPWDKSVLKDIEKGIGLANVNLHPVIDGEIIRITIPPLNEETRRDLVKLVHQKIESFKKILRQSRNDLKKEIEELKGTANVSEDNIHAWVEELQKAVDDCHFKLDEMAKLKEQELMTI